MKKKMTEKSKAIIAKIIVVFTALTAITLNGCEAYNRYNDYGTKGLVYYFIGLIFCIILILMFLFSWSYLEKSDGEKKF